MRNPNRRSVAIAQIVVMLVVALGIATPASAQFGALKKKLKGEAANKAVEAAAPDTPAETGAAPAAAGAPATAPEDNSTLVLTSEVVDRFMAGLRASKAEYGIAAKEDTPYGRYNRAKLAYDAAKAKCEQAQAAWPTRLAADEKLMNKSQAMMDKMTDAMQKQDQLKTQMYNDSVLAMVDPSCLVKQPEQPSDYWDAQRGLESRSGQAGLKAAQMSPTQFSQVSERVYAMLSGAEVPGGASASEKSAVSAKSAELKSLLGIRDAQEARVAKQAPAPAPAVVTQPAPQPTATMPAGAAAMNACVVQNVQAHEAEIKALGDRGEAAKKAGNTAGMMAIADTIMRIQMAGCGGNR